ncbi:hypothetical protein NDU88_008730 [Pleurodeles waltl]|uniref:Uncharacterized protein n=1 Tax=Pleurodeles waltl TaxID=8319 RepID=A0AAV7NX47_PLEWA|nr:hypothetical protein NDU88_008730 [Pleurodeles waltl]
MPELMGRQRRDLGRWLINAQLLCWCRGAEHGKGVSDNRPEARRQLEKERAIGTAARQGNWARCLEDEGDPWAGRGRGEDGDCSPPMPPATAAVIGRAEPRSPCSVIDEASQRPAVTTVTPGLWNS